MIILKSSEILVSKRIEKLTPAIDKILYAIPMDRKAEVKIKLAIRPFDM